MNFKNEKTLYLFDKYIKQLLYIKHSAIYLHICDRKRFSKFLTQTDLSFQDFKFYFFFK